MRVCALQSAKEPPKKCGKFPKKLPVSLGIPKSIPGLRKELKNYTRKSGTSAKVYVIHIMSKEREIRRL